MAKQPRRENRTQSVRVLHFPDAKPELRPSNPPREEGDALADAIRKAWTQKSTAPIKQRANG
jgi:hypothetical protein